MIKLLTATAAMVMLIAARTPPPVDPVDQPPVFNSAVTLMAAPLAILISSWDRDGDRAVTRAEFDAGVAGSFKVADGDSDGTVRLIELGHWAETELGSPGALPGRFDFDRNTDDRISQAEFIAEFARRWTDYDRDKDGRITRAELLTVGIPRTGPRDRIGRGGPSPQ